MGTAQECYKLFWTNPWSKTPRNNSCTATSFHHKKSTQLDEQDARDTAGEARTNSFVTFLFRPLYMDVPVLADQQELINISSVRTQDVVWKICRERWMIGTDGERKRERAGELCAVSSSWWWWWWWSIFIRWPIVTSLSKALFSFLNYSQVKTRAKVPVKSLYLSSYEPAQYWDEWQLSKFDPKYLNAHVPD